MLLDLLMRSLSSTITFKTVESASLMWKLFERKYEANSVDSIKADQETWQCDYSRR